MLKCAQRGASWMGMDGLDGWSWCDGRRKEGFGDAIARHETVYIGGGGILRSVRGKAIGKPNQAAN